MTKEHPEPIGIEETIAAIEAQTAGGDEMLKRYGAIASTVLRHGHEVEPNRALRVIRALSVGKQALQVGVDYDDEGKVPDTLSYTIAGGGSIRSGESITLRMAVADPLSEAHKAVGFADAETLKTGTIGDAIRNFHAFNAGLPDLESSITAFEQVVAGSGVET